MCDFRGLWQPGCFSHSGQKRQRKEEEEQLRPLFGSYTVEARWHEKKTGSYLQQEDRSRKPWFARNHFFFFSCLFPCLFLMFLDRILF